MIQALTRWAADTFHVIEADAIHVGIVGRVGGLVSVLDLDPRHYLAFVEGVARKAPHHAAMLDALYEESRPLRPEEIAELAAEKRAERRASIDRLARSFGG